MDLYAKYNLFLCPESTRNNVVLALVSRYSTSRHSKVAFDSHTVYDLTTPVRICSAAAPHGRRYSDQPGAEASPTTFQIVGYPAIERSYNELPASRVQHNYSEQPV